MKDVISMEEWRPIPNWENLYEVSNLGRVRSKINGNIRTLDKNNCGYYRITLYNHPRRERIFIHRLVASVFIPVNDYNKQVNHIDGDKSNNTVYNLEWVTQSENEIHAIRNNLKGVWRGEFAVEYNDNLFAVIKCNQSEFARELGVSKTLVRLWLNKKSTTYTNYNIRNIYFL